MADISGLVTRANTVVSDANTSIVAERYYINSVADIGGLDIRVTGTHEIIPIKKGDRLIELVISIRNIMTSGGAATARFYWGAIAVTGLLTIAGSTPIGRTLRCGNAPSLTAVVFGVGATIAAADDTIDLVVGTADLTAGSWEITVIKEQNVAGVNLT